jgi:hypothetical protein
MTTITPQPDLQPEILQKLNRALDLVLMTAEAASAAKDHKVAIQAAREVTRIATLITKMTASKAKPAPAAKARQATRPIAVDQAPEDDICSEDIILPDIETLFPPERVASWDNEIKSMYETFTKNYREFQDLCDEVAAGLPVAGRLALLKPNQKSGSTSAAFAPALKVA